MWADEAPKARHIPSQHSITRYDFMRGEHAEQASIGDAQINARDSEQHGVGLVI